MSETSAAARTRVEREWELPPRGIALVKQAEGYRPRPYDDGKGNLTIGYGLNLRTTWLPPLAALVALVELLDDCRREVLVRFPWAARLDAVRAWVLIELAYWVGLAGLARFRRMLSALESGAVDRAADELRASRLAADPLPGVRRRAERLARMLETGQWPEEPRTSHENNEGAVPAVDHPPATDARTD